MTSWMKPENLAVIMNTTCLVAGLMYLFSFSSSARFLSVSSSLAASMYIVYTNYGIPQVSRQSIKVPMQEWFAKCMSGAEFPFLFFTLMFVNTTGPLFPFGLADYLSVVLIVRRATWFLGVHGSRAWATNPVWLRSGSTVWQLIKSQESKVLACCNLLEVSLGFWYLLLLLTPSRRLMTTFVYWTYLRIRYMGPRSRPGQIVAWSTLDRATTGLRTTFPLADKPVQWGVAWFNKA